MAKKKLVQKRYSYKISLRKAVKAAAVAGIVAAATELVHVPETITVTLAVLLITFYLDWWKHARAKAGRGKHGRRRGRVSYAG